MSNFCSPCQSVKGGGEYPLFARGCTTTRHSEYFSRKNPPPQLRRAWAVVSPLNCSAFSRIHNAPRAALYSLHIGAGHDVYIIILGAGSRAFSCILEALAGVQGAPPCIVELCGCGCTYSTLANCEIDRRNNNIMPFIIMPLQAFKRRFLTFSGRVYNYTPRRCPRGSRLFWKLWKPNFARFQFFLCFLLLKIQII